MRQHADRYRKDDPDRRFLQSRVWREKIRPRQLSKQPLCEHCWVLGRTQEAEQVDHIKRPGGDTHLQRNPENFQSLCRDHHQRKSLWERRNDGRPLQIGVHTDGWPIELPGGCVPKAGKDNDQPNGPSSRELVRPTGASSRKFSGSTEQPTRAENSRKFTLKSRAEGR